MTRKPSAGPTPESLAASGTEDGEQTALFCYATTAALSDPRWLLLYAIPNGGARSPATAARMVATGAKAGFPDVGLPYVIYENNRIACPGLFIELKRRHIPGKQKAGVTSALQTGWHIKLQLQGYRVYVCYGYLEAVEVIRNYFNEG